MRAAVCAIAAAVVVVLVGAPLAAWPRVVRLPAVLVPALLLLLLVTRPWKRPGIADRFSTWQPSARVVWSCALVVAGFLSWYLLTRFRSGQINAVDFTIYYDRPCYQTVQGRPLLVEISDTPGFSHRSELADHAYWNMLAVCGLYALRPTPLWLHIIPVLAVVAGAVLVLRLLQGQGASGALAGASALALVLNDNTARALNYGFHPEILYICLVPWMLYAALRGARKWFLAALLACVLVKEDAFLPILAASVAIACLRFRVMSGKDRLLFLVLPTLVGLANLAVYYRFVVPYLTGDSLPSYAHFWGNYGETPVRAFVGMCRHPRRVMRGTMTSGVFRALQPHLFLPLIGWQWSLGVLPIVALYGASANEQVRAFGIYYGVVLVPFLVLGAAWGARTVFHRLMPKHAELASAAAILLGVLLVGSGNRGYSLRPWRAEVAAVPEALERLGDEPVVLVQSGLFPHAGYDERFELLTRETLVDSRYAGAVLLLARRIGAYPLSRREVARLMEQPPIRPMPGELVAVRRPQPDVTRRVLAPRPSRDVADSPDQ